MNHYQILGVHSNATKAEIESAFRKKSLHCHPDKLINKGIFLLNYFDLIIVLGF